MGMCAPHLSLSVRQMRGTAPAPIPGAKISVCHGVGGMLAASGTIIMSNGRYRRSDQAGDQRRLPGQSLSHRARAVGDDLEVGCGRRIELAAALFPILQCPQRDVVDAGEFLLGHAH